MKKREEIELRKTNRLTITIMSVLILANSSITAVHLYTQNKMKSQERKQ